MATVTVKTLKKMLSAKYKHVSLAAHDIITVVSMYKDLKPVMDTYVFNDGSFRDLMSLRGTVPVNYRGNVYNIPVCLWLMDTYPYNPPICFVKPTSAMMIKSGKHIDANGKMYLPYLHEWKHPQSDLYGLIQVMIVVFGEEPPVFSRPTTPRILLTPEHPSLVGQSPAPEHLNPMADSGISTTGNGDTVKPTLSTSDQTELASDDCKPSLTLSAAESSKPSCRLSAPETHPATASAPETHPAAASAPETHPAAVSAPEMLPPALASLCLSGTTMPASEESVLQRQKLQLEIEVLQRQKQVLEIQEEYYSIKLRRLLGDNA
ncbi:tumor susceptibility gene 101 protein-like isoform X2 [Anguilla anguilla]|uniref:tumor susceptibility gene 101 protein-like isoform X2 n=1 Tax=Anguilla anguilla TaxID=7936 RepID=UPI0015AE4FF2|nr:tumor susceptibility gene 101 protein-like isoform X2 [Anguilla anguilla]